MTSGGIRRGALVTGGARGIGAALVLALARDGYEVAFTYRRSRKEAETLVRQVKEAGGMAQGIPCDVTDPEQVRLLLERLNREGRVDVLINNVGDYLKRRLDRLRIDQWHAMIHSNLHATFYCCHYALPYMVKREYGRIINIGYASCGQVVAKPLITPYFIAKQGVLLLTKSIAAVYTPHGITCNMVSPGVMENSRSRPTRQIPAGRLGRLEELVAVVRFLLSPEAGYISGAHLEVSGGWNI